MLRPQKERIIYLLFDPVAGFEQESFDIAQIRPLTEQFDQFSGIIGDDIVNAELYEVGHGIQIIDGPHVDGFVMAIGGPDRITLHDF